MMTVRKSGERGHADHGWLDTRHSFSFAEYFDPQHMGFRALRVINEDHIAGGGGFPTHPHRDMEIVTWVISGALEHRDSTGGGSVIHAGEVQRMSAGTGIAHSEFNSSRTEPVHLYQIWLLPGGKGVTPAYEQKRFDPAQRRGRLQFIATPDGRDGSLTIHQDATLQAAILAPGQSVTHELAPGRHAWLQVVRGTVDLAGQRLLAGDGAAVTDERKLTISVPAKMAVGEAEVLLFDLP